MQAISAHVPKLSALSGKLIAQAPQLGINLFEVDVNAASKDATEFMSFINTAQKNGKNRKLMNKFDAEWNALHEQVQNETVDVEPQPDAETLCWVVGMCTCDQDGMALKKMVNSLLLCIKTMYPRTDPKLNAMLGNSNVFIHVIGCTISLLSEMSPRYGPSF